MEAVTRVAARQRTDVTASAVVGRDVELRHIIAAHHEDMRRVCLAISGDVAIADEAVQAAWLVAWKKLDRIYSAEHLRPWLVSVAVNEAKHLLRSRRRRSQLELATDGPGDVGGGDPAARIGTVDLWAALRRMEPDDRALLAMRYGAGFNSNELAIATGKTPAAIRQRLKRLVDRLREELDDG